RLLVYYGLFFESIFLAFVSDFVVLFFFQAEDGIRYRNVTGVQTCALPIWSPYAARHAWNGWGSNYRCQPASAQTNNLGTKALGRSEERRVGKECRSRRGREE